MIILLIAVYSATGIYTVDSGQQAVILRFGKPVSKTISPGINYHLPFPFERALKVRVRQVQKIVIQDKAGGALESYTGDENLFMVKAIVGYDVKDAENYLFNIINPDAVIQSTSQTCMSAEIAGMTVDDIMTTGKSILRLILKDKIQERLDKLDSGVRIISVELTEIAPPQNVSRDFKAVSDAREKKQRIIKESEGYANTIVPKARGEANSIIAQAQALANEKKETAFAKANAFNALYREYLRQPEITSRLRYLDAMKTIFSRSRLIIDSDPSQSTYYIKDDGRIQKKPANNSTEDSK